MGLTIGIVTKMQTKNRLKILNTSRVGETNEEQKLILEEEVEKARNLIWASLLSEFVG